MRNKNSFKPREERETKKAKNRPLSCVCQKKAVPLYRICKYEFFISHNHARDGQCAGDAVLQHLLHAAWRERYTAEAQSVFPGSVLVPDDLERIAL